MTYYSILAIFPALAALVAIYGIFTDPGIIAKHLDDISAFVPGGAIDVAREQLTRVASKGNQTLGSTFAVGLAISLWSANAAMKALFDTLNIVYGETEKRGFFKLNAISLTFTFAGIALVMTALAAVVALPVALDYLYLSAFFNLLIRIGRWPVMFAALAIAIACVYRFGPSRKAPRCIGSPGKLGRDASLARGFRLVLLLRGSFRYVQRDIRFAWCRDRLYDMAVDLSDLYPTRRGAQR